MGADEQAVRMEHEGVRTQAKRFSHVLAYAPPAGLALTTAVVLAAPPSLKPLFAVMSGAVLGALALALAAWRGDTLSPPARLVALLAGVGLVATLAGSATSRVPRMALFGVVGQHNGWLLWADATLWFVVGALALRGRALRSAVWCVTALGAVAAVSALLDASHLLDIARYSPEVAGILESSVSLGQVLLLGTAAATAALLFERRLAFRVVAGGIVAAQVLALVLAEARAAQVALLIGVVFGAPWVLGDKLDPLLRRAATAVAAGGLAATIVGIGVIGWLGPGRVVAVDRVLTDRPTIWHSAISQLPQRLLTGGGPDSFSCIVSWADAGGGVTWQATSSPHDILLDWLLGGGIVALLAFAGASMLAWMAAASEVSTGPPAPKILVIGVGAWGLTLLTSWTDPLAACVAAFLIGALVPRGHVSRVSDFSAVRLVASVLVVAGAAAIVWAGVPLLALERAWAVERAAGTGDLPTFVDRWEQWPDPAFANDALRASLLGLPSSAPTAAALASEVLDKMPFDANAAVLGLELAVGLGRCPPSGPYPSIGEALARGSRADATSGIWEELERLTRTAPKAAKE